MTLNFNWPGTADRLTSVETSSAVVIAGVKTAVVMMDGAVVVVTD